MRDKRRGHVSIVHQRKKEIVRCVLSDDFRGGISVPVSVMASPSNDGYDMDEFDAALDASLSVPVSSKAAASGLASLPQGPMVTGLSDALRGDLSEYLDGTLSVDGRLPPKAATEKPPVTLETPTRESAKSRAGRHRKIASSPCGASASLILAHAVYSCPLPVARTVPQLRIGHHVKRRSTGGASPPRTSFDALDSVYGLPKTRSPAISPVRAATAVAGSRVVANNQPKSAPTSPPTTVSAQPSVFTTSSSTSAGAWRFPSTTRPAVPPNNSNPFKLSTQDARALRRSEGEHKALMTSWLTR